MKLSLCFFAIALTLAIYPVMFSIHPELPFWGTIEVDIMNWWRMLVVSIAGIPCLLLIRKKDIAVIIYTALLLLSYFFSHYEDTAFYGSPDRHEGLITLLGYIGIYLAYSKYKMTKELKSCLSFVVYISFAVCVMQFIYGNFFHAIPFRWIMPSLMYQAENSSLYGLQGNPNHLGLFCALFFPYVLIEKKYVQMLLILVMLIGSQSRGAWISVFVTTIIISRRSLLYLLLVCVILAIPFREKIIFKFRDSLSQLHYPLQDGDLDNRVYMWKSAIPALKTDLIIGDGPSTFALYVPQFKWFPHAVIDRPHNMFINIWQNTGLLSLLTLFYIAVKDLIFTKSKALKMGCLGFLLAGLFTDSVLCVTPYFLIFLGGAKNEHT